MLNRPRTCGLRGLGSLASLLASIASLAGLLALAACRDSPTLATLPQDSVTLALPTLALDVELTRDTIAAGDTTTVRVTATNLSTTPVSFDVDCAGGIGFRVETLTGELPVWEPRFACPGMISRMHFAAGEVRVLEFRIPRPRPGDAIITPGEYQVRATLGLDTSGFRSRPARLVVTPRAGS